MIPSHLQGAGASPNFATALCGTSAIGITALGTNQATSTQLPAVNNYIATAAGGTGVRLPPCTDGAEVWIYNNGASTVAIYPFELSGVTFNGGGPVSSILNGKAMLFKAVSPAIWLSFVTA